MNPSYPHGALGALLLLAIFFFVACGCVAVLLALSRWAVLFAQRRLAPRRVRRVLSVDWWTRFEHDLCAYQSPQWTAARKSELIDDAGRRPR